MTVLVDCARLTKTFGGELVAVDDLSFQVEEGSALSVIGRNGAGKSTLLRVLAGITRPDRGTVVRPARLTSIIELGAGFAPDLTGRENLELGLVMCSVGRGLRAARAAALSDLEPIGDALDTPVKRYSTGMLARLAFAIAFRAEPKVLLIDEVLSIGDLTLRRSVIDGCRSVRERGGAVIVATHDLGLATSIASSTLWIDRGRCRGLGDPSAVIEQYEAELCGVPAWGGREGVRLTGIRVLTEDPQPGRRLEVQGLLEVDRPIDDLAVRLDIRPQVGDASWERPPEESLYEREFTTCARTIPERLPPLAPGRHRATVRIAVNPVASADVAVSLVLVDLQDGTLIDEIATSLRIGSAPGFPGHHMEIVGQPAVRPRPDHGD